MNRACPNGISDMAPFLMSAVMRSSIMVTCCGVNVMGWGRRRCVGDVSNRIRYPRTVVRTHSSSVMVCQADTAEEIDRKVVPAAGVVEVDAALREVEAVPVECWRDVPGFCQEEFDAPRHGVLR